jgi:copper chaperone CopZ
MRTAAMAVASLAVLTWLGAVQAEEVKLEVKGAYCGNCAKALTKALEDAGAKVKGTIKATKEDPQFVTVDLAEGSDVGKVGKSVAEAKTPHNPQEQG